MNGLVLPRTAHLRAMVIAVVAAIAITIAVMLSGGAFNGGGSNHANYHDVKPVANYHDVKPPVH